MLMYSTHPKDNTKTAIIAKMSHLPICVAIWSTARTASFTAV